MTTIAEDPISIATGDPIVGNDIDITLTLDGAATDGGVAAFEIPARLLFSINILDAGGAGQVGTFHVTGTRNGGGVTEDVPWTNDNTNQSVESVGSFDTVTEITFTMAVGPDATLTVGNLEATDINCECVDEHPDRTLLELRTSLLRRLGFSAQIANPPPGMAALLDDFLRDAQEQLYERFAAMRTERYFRWTMTPGVRFYGLRANEGACDLRLDPYKITWVGIEDTANTWQPLIPGIHATYYTSFQRGRPSRYEVRQCIEVYPPPDAAYVLRIKGHFGLTALSADTDQTTLPSQAVFLLALGNAKAHYGQPDAANYFGQANSFIGGQVAGSHLTRRYVPGAAPQAPMPQPRMVAYDDE